MCPAWEVHVFSVTALDSGMSDSSYPHSTKWKSLGEFQMNEEEIPESVLKTIFDFFSLKNQIPPPLPPPPLYHPED